MPKTWVVVAESSRARVFELEKRNLPLIEIQDFNHPEGHLHERDLGSNAPGRGFSGKNGIQHGVEPTSSFKEKGAENFAKSICEYLETAHEGKQFERLVLMAPPDFMGILRKHLAEGVKKSVTHELTKNLVRLGPDEIHEHLP